MQILNVELVEATKKNIKQLNFIYIVTLIVGGALLLPLLNTILGGILAVSILNGLLILLYVEVKKHYTDRLLLSAFLISLCPFVLNIIQIKIGMSLDKSQTLSIGHVAYIVLSLVAYGCVVIGYSMVVKSFLNYRHECRQFEQMLLAPSNVIQTKIKPATVMSIGQWKSEHGSALRQISFIIRALLVIALYFGLMRVDVIVDIVFIPFKLISLTVDEYVNVDIRTWGLMVNAWANVYLQLIFVFSFIGLFFDEIKRGLKQMKWSTFSLIFIGYGLSLLITTFVNILLGLFGLTIPESENQKILKQIGVVAPVALTLTTVFLAPITEELVFRQGIAEGVYRVTKFLFGNVNQEKIKDAAVIIAIIISGTLFGMIHVMNHGDYIAGIPYVVSGLVYTTFYFLGGKNVSVTIGIHMLSNLVATLIIL